jgi:hypothetical protein
MSRNSIPISAILRCAFLLTVLAAASSALPLQAQDATVQTSTQPRAAIPWVIQLSEPSTGTKPVYQILSPSPIPKLECQFYLFDPSQGPKTLRVCPGDTVQWVAKTPGMQSELYIYHDDAIFDYNGGSPQGFDASNGAKSDLVSIKLDSSLQGSHEYHVALFDKSTNHLYLEDPKIIIGGGGSPTQDCEKYLAIFVTDKKSEDRVNKFCRDIKKSK